MHAKNTFSTTQLEFNSCMVITLSMVYNKYIFLGDTNMPHPKRGNLLARPAVANSEE